MLFVMGYVVQNPGESDWRAKIHLCCNLICEPKQNTSVSPFSAHFSLWILGLVTPA